MMITLLVVAILSLATESKGSASKVGQSLGKLAETKIAERSANFPIFFAETSTKDRLTLREACAVESASHHNPHCMITLRSVRQLRSNDEALQLLLKRSNVRAATMNLTKLFRNTPLEQWHRDGSIEQSLYPVEHLSDAVRLAVLWKKGGMYLDTDMLCLRPFPNSLRNTLSKESEHHANSAAMIFDAGHKFLHACMVGYVTNYSPSNWGNHGPILATRVLCDIGKVSRIDNLVGHPEICDGITLLSENAFYPIPWPEYQRLFLHEPIPQNSFAIHLWSKFSRSTTVTPGSGVLLDMVARENCPSVYELMQSRKML